MTNVVEDGCTGHVAVVPPVGPTVDDMATALAGLSPFVLTKPPSDVTIDGFRGKHLELTVPDLDLGGSGSDTEFTDCTDGELGATSEAAVVRQLRLQPSRPVREIWLLDVDGTRVDDRGRYFAGSSEGDIAELRSILDSIDIVPRAWASTLREPHGTIGFRRRRLSKTVAVRTMSIDASWNGA